MDLWLISNLPVGLVNKGQGVSEKVSHKSSSSYPEPMNLLISVERASKSRSISVDLARQRSETSHGQYRVWIKFFGLSSSSQKKLLTILFRIDSPLSRGFSSGFYKQVSSCRRFAKGNYFSALLDLLLFVFEGFYHLTSSSLFFLPSFSSFLPNVGISLFRPTFYQLTFSLDPPLNRSQRRTE